MELEKNCELASSGSGQGLVKGSWKYSTDTQEFVIYNVSVYIYIIFFFIVFSYIKIFTCTFR